MPLFELFRMTKEKLDSAKQKNPSSSTDLSFEPENNLVELVWENGQILRQGQSSRTRKSPTSNSLPSHCLPSHAPKNRDRDVGNGTGTKMGKFGTVDSVLNEIHMPEPSGEMGLNQDNDMVPWLNYAVDESLQQEYCSDFGPELSGVTGNGLSSQNNFASFDKRSSSNQFNRELNTVSANHDVSLENVSKVSSVGGGEATRPRSSTSPLYTSSSQHCQTSFPYLRSRVSDSTANGMKNSTDNGIFRGSNPTSTENLSGLKMQKQDQRMFTNKSGVMNFSHFARPVALVKANLQNTGSIPGTGLSRMEMMGSKDKSSVSSSSLVESPLIDSSGGLRKEASSHYQPVAVTSKVDVKAPEVKLSEQPASEPPEAICREDAINIDRKPSQVHAESATKGLVDGEIREKTIEPVVASSVCSGNSVERASDDQPHNLKRKHCDPEDSECPSEDVEEESVGVKKAAPARVGTGSKRSRAAEVHNLSERRRRDRINEKMRALQELIPNCNKVDKASMLDEAIEYLKTLQLQVQFMSMGAGLYMPPMMYPSGMQHMHAAHMAHFSPMGIGMGMGVGYGMGMPDMNGGSSCYPMVQVPAMHGAHFPGTSVSGPTALQGMAGSNFQLFGIPGQGHPISMPHLPIYPLSGVPLMKSAMGMNASGMVGPTDNMDAATGSTSKDSLQNVNSQVMQNTGANGSVNQTSSQCEAANEGFAHPPAVQDNCQSSEVTGHGTFSSSSKNENKSNKAACYD